MTPVFMLLLQPGVTVWTMPAQAQWPEGQDLAGTIEVIPDNNRINIESGARMMVVVRPKGTGWRFSPFLQATRGIAFKVTTLDGRAAAPREPIMPSPPPPPLQPEQLVPATEASPFVVQVAEGARYIFPGPGSYRLSVLLNLMDTSQPQTRRIYMESKPVEVQVTE